MRQFVWSGVIGVAFVVAAVGYGCGQSSFGNCSDNGTCVGTDAGDASLVTMDAIVVTHDGTTLDAASTDAGAGAGEADVAAEADAGASDASDGGGDRDGGDGGDGSQCDPHGDPSVNGCAIGEAYGVFVSSSLGVEDAGTAGTRSAPWKTITEGIASAVLGGQRRVYICGGTYGESVVLDGSHGVSLYGGFDCGGGTWTWSGSKTQVTSAPGAYALRIDATTKALVVQDMSFSAPAASGQDPSGNGKSSVAGFISRETAGVTLVRVGLQAGAGADGASGAAPVSNWFSADPAALQGNGADGGAGGAQKDCPCPAWGDSTGGAGGAGSGSIDLVAGDGGAGTANPPAATTRAGHDGTGGVGYDPNGPTGTCLPGRIGADGVARADGGASAATVGSLGLLGWAPAAGVPGVAGNPGQGGGGGGGGVAGGGGGGCGGCGGAGGVNGGGGGASIALLVFQAGVSAQTTTTLTTAAAGNGGAGSAGETGSSGGGGGNIGACGGGQGGSGGGGQGGGGGAGGVSVAVLSDSSSAVAIDATTRFSQPLQAATRGAGGGGADGGSGVANAGPPGSPGRGGTVQQTLTL